MHELERTWFRGWKRPENPQRMSRLQLIAGKVGSKFIEASAAPILKQFTYWHSRKTRNNKGPLKRGPH